MVTDHKAAKEHASLVNDGWDEDESNLAACYLERDKELAAERKAREAAERDAKRYRWLRDRDDAPDNLKALWADYNAPSVSVDAAIDEKMEKDNA